MMEGNHSTYPITITLDEYTGVYSGGKYVAWNLYPWQIPKDIAGDDLECEDIWWSKIESCPAPICCGKGDTPEESIANMELVREDLEGRRMLEKWDALVDSEIEWNDLFNQWWIESIEHGNSEIENRTFEISGKDLKQYLEYRKTGLTPKDILEMKKKENDNE